MYFLFGLTSLCAKKIGCVGGGDSCPGESDFPCSILLLCTLESQNQIISWNIYVVPSFCHGKLRIASLGKVWCLISWSRFLLQSNQYCWHFTKNRKTFSTVRMEATFGDLNILMTSIKMNETTNQRKDNNWCQQTILKNSKIFTKNIFELELDGIMYPQDFLLCSSDKRMK